MPNACPFLYLAPIRGLTDAFFRQTLCRHFAGFDAAVAPFINPQRKSLYDDRMLRDVLPENNGPLPLIPQLLHTDPEQFLVLAGRLADLGYRQVNWNLGCPAPMVARKKRGSGLLPYPEEIVAILSKIMPRLGVELSIKTRLGFHERTELAALLPALDDFPVKEIILHTRLGRQLYKGPTDPDGFAECRRQTSHTLVYNGDINDLATFRMLAAHFPTVGRWMIGRGALANPFLAEEIKGYAVEPAAKRKERIVAFHAELYAGYTERLSGPGHVLGRLKQLWIYLVGSFPGQEKALKKILKSSTLAGYDRAVDQLFAA